MITIFTRSDLKEMGNSPADTSISDLAGRKKRNAAAASAMSLYVEEDTVYLLNDSPINLTELDDMVSWMTKGDITPGLTLDSCFQNVLARLREMEQGQGVGGVYVRRGFEGLLIDALRDSPAVRAVLRNAIFDLRRKGELV